ncbi:MAG: hypothetical protein ACFFD2_26190, partial [Promethearchaeota archaeon]
TYSLIFTGMVKASFFLGKGGVLIISLLGFSCSTTIVFTPTFLVLFCNSSNLIATFSFLLFLTSCSSFSSFSTLSLGWGALVDSTVDFSLFDN